jgi:hypothetical protein
MGPLKGGEFQHMWRVITTIVHYTDLSIFRSVDQFRIIYKALRGTLSFKDLLRDRSSDPIGPIIFVSSDQHVSAFDASVLLHIFNDKILRPAVNSCRERGVELTDIERNVVQAAESFKDLQEHDLSWVLGGVTDA